MKIAYTVLILLLSFSSLVKAQPNRTNLGPNGNNYALQRFNQYLENGAVCDPPIQGMRRIVVTGFGPFDGGVENASRKIVESLGDFSTPKTDVDVYGRTTTQKIESVDYQICTIILATAWDISAAILISEMEKFSPDFILMNGIGNNDVTFETGNSNRALFAGGFDIDGKPVADNTPKQNYVLPPSDSSVPFISHLSWDAEAANKSVSEKIAEMGFESSVAEPGYAANNYICNNLAFALTHAAQNYSTLLAGGMIELTPQLENAPKVGFIHYPSNIPTDVGSLKTWDNVLRKILSSQF